jgi:hypothetical protein
LPFFAANGSMVLTTPSISVVDRVAQLVMLPDTAAEAAGTEPGFFDTPPGFSGRGRSSAHDAARTREASLCSVVGISRPSALAVFTLAARRAVPTGGCVISASRRRAECW